MTEAAGAPPTGEATYHRVPRWARDYIRRRVVDDLAQYVQVQRELAAGADGHPPLKVGANALRRWARQAKQTEGLSMADRITRILDAQLTAMERGNGKVDLERLDRIARTLKTVQTLSPSKPRTETGLAALAAGMQATEDLETADGSSDGQSDAPTGRIAQLRPSV